MGLSDKQNEKVAAFVRPQLAEGERLEAVVGQVMSGPSFFWSFVSAWLVFLDKPFALAASNRRLFVVRLARKLTSYPPAEIVGAYPLSDVRVDRFTRGTITGRLVLNVGQAKPLDYKVQTVMRDSAEQLANVIGRGAPPPSP
jgi:hypothetical protein